MPSSDISDVQAKVLQIDIHTLTDYLQLNGWFGAVVVNGDGTININGVPLTSDQMLLLGASMGITTTTT